MYKIISISTFFIRRAEITSLAIIIFTICVVKTLLELVGALLSVVAEICFVASQERPAIAVILTHWFVAWSSTIRVWKALALSALVTQTNHSFAFLVRGTSQYSCQTVSSSNPSGSIKNSPFVVNFVVKFLPNHFSITKSK